MVSPSATCSYHASIIASSAAAAVRNGLAKALRECSWPRCRSDQIQVAAYWLGMAMHRRHPRRVLTALRVLLTDPPDSCRALIVARPSWVRHAVPDPPHLADDLCFVLHPLPSGCVQLSAGRRQVRELTNPRRRRCTLRVLAPVRPDQSALAPCAPLGILACADSAVPTRWRRWSAAPTASGSATLT